MILFPAISAILSAFDANLSKVILSKFKQQNFLYSYFIIITILLSPLVITLFHNTNLVKLVIISMIGGLLSFAANTLYYKSLEKNKVSTIAPLKVIIGITTIIIGGIIYSSERFGYKTYICLGLILISIYLINQRKGIKTGFKEQLNKNNYQAIIAFVIWGIFFVLIKEGLSIAQPITLYWLIGINFLIWQKIFYKKTLRFINLKQELCIKKKKVKGIWVFSILAMVILSEYVILYYAIGRLSAVISILIYNSDVILMTILSSMLHKDEITLRKTMAIVCSFMGIVFLQIL